MLKTADIISILFSRVYIITVQKMDGSTNRSDPTTRK